MYNRIIANTPANGLSFISIAMMQAMMDVHSAMGTSMLSTCGA
jgi:hypothetical protein